MAFGIRVILLHLFISLLAVQQKKGVDAQKLLIKVEKPKLQKCGFDRIYQFGDSLSDTGNCVRERDCAAHTETGSFPYGIDLLQKATGRCSDGFIMLDFIAMECDLPLVNPSKDENADFSHGANFAVSGATALSVEYLTRKKIAVSYTNSSLSVQVDWMTAHFKSICYPDCRKYLENSLFLVGEIGGDDVNYGFKQGKPIDELRIMVPDIVDAIVHAVRTVIDFGGTRIIVPGNFPSGCFPFILTLYMNKPSTAYDEYHCVIEWNNFIMIYNNHLQQAIHQLNIEYPNISIVYGDYYNAYFWLLQNAVILGFDENTLQIVCCGIGGDYNFNISRKCGTPGVEACAGPSTYISWDGIHLTQKANKWITKWLIDDMLPQLNCHV